MAWNLATPDSAHRLCKTGNGWRRPIGGITRSA